MPKFAFVPGLKLRIFLIMFMILANSQHEQLSGTEPENFMGGDQSKKKLVLYNFFIKKFLFLLFFKQKTTYKQKKVSI
jgi:hypothetical protein